MSRTLLSVTMLVAVLSMGARDGGCLGEQRDEGEPCPAIGCADDCGEAGYVMGDDGCSTCECVEPIVLVCDDDADCATAQICDTENFCERPPGCTDGDTCIAVCYGRCVAAPDPVGPCMGDADCQAGERCNNEDYCDSNPACADTDYCTEECWGRCEAVTSPDYCTSDADCSTEELCTAGDECLRDPECDTVPTQACDDVCYGRCVARCADGGLNCLPDDQALCVVTGGTWAPQSCGHYDCGRPRECAAIIPGCNCGENANFVEGVGCVESEACKPDPDPCTRGAWRDQVGNCRTPVDGVQPARCCAQLACDDGSELLCDSTAPVCPRGLSVTVKNGCWACVDPVTCGEASTCDDDIEVMCMMIPPACSPPFVAAAQDGCWACLDPTHGCASGCEADADCARGEHCGQAVWDPCGDCEEGQTCCDAPAYVYGVCQAACSPVMCELYCEHGFATDPETGCEVCSCNEPPTCDCPAVEAPVCGVDGQTYGNSCEASCDGIRVAHEGACDCQISCFVHDPVCGANGVTYACGQVEAACNGVEVVHDGECATCEIQCLVADPVCGADGVTYACGDVDARCHGTSVRHEGACGETCQADSQCAWGQKCMVHPEWGQRVGECLPVDFCMAVEDCRGLAPTISCVGTWSCEQSACEYTCSS